MPDWKELGTPVLVGELFSEQLRGKEVFSFGYNNAWLKSDYAYQLDPDLGLFEGIQYLKDEKSNFGLFLDSSPDRWGRVLMKRFDRTIEGKRIHFASAMTLLGHTDGADASSGVSYLEIVDFISKSGANPEKDLKQLWRRIVFSICVSNTDDHLRNHGFLLTRKGWVLSPTYDINPVETGMGLKLNISENDNALDLDLALKVAPYFRVEKEDGKRIINEIIKIVSNWRKYVNKYGISRLEQENKANAFIS